ncbi:MAG: septum formation initiator family protein [Patescibacteria group bacterium]|nr:septum formation initiator family protein [Patescibacteria group bacterium]
MEYRFSTKKDNGFSKPLFYAGILVFAVLLYSLIRTYGQYLRSKEIVAKSEEKVAKELEKQKELKDELIQTENIYFTEKILRDKLGMAREGEIVFILPSEDELRKIAPKYEKKTQESKISNWERWLNVFL